MRAFPIAMAVLLAGSSCQTQSPPSVQDTPPAKMPAPVLSAEDAELTKYMYKITPEKWAAMTSEERVDLARKAKAKREADLAGFQSAFPKKTQAQRDAELKQSVYLKDALRWRQFYIDQGYTVEEAEYLARRAAVRP